MHFHSFPCLLLFFYLHSLSTASAHSLPNLSFNVASPYSLLPLSALLSLNPIALVVVASLWIVALFCFFLFLFYLRLHLGFPFIPVRLSFAVRFASVRVHGIFWPLRPCPPDLWQFPLLDGWGRHKEDSTLTRRSESGRGAARTPRQFRNRAN